jgi:hypothetical protein
MIAFVGMRKSRGGKRQPPKSPPSPDASESDDVPAAVSDVDVDELAELVRLLKKYAAWFPGVAGGTFLLLGGGAWYVVSAVHNVEKDLKGLSARFDTHIDNHNKQWSEGPDIPAPERGDGPMQLPNVDKGPDLRRPEPVDPAPPVQPSATARKTDNPKRPAPTEYVSPQQCVHRASMKIMSCDLARPGTCLTKSGFTPQRYQEFVNKSGSRSDALVCDSIHDPKRQTASFPD